MNGLKKLTKKELIETIERQNDYFASVLASFKLCSKCRIKNKSLTNKK